MYKLADHVTEEMLIENFFEREEIGLIRGYEMGWAIKADLETRTLEYCDSEYAKKYEKIGGMRTFILDLIEEGMVGYDDET